MPHGSRSTGWGRGAFTARVDRSVAESRGVGAPRLHEAAISCVVLHDEDCSSYIRCDSADACGRTTVKVWCACSKTILWRKGGAFGQHNHSAQDTVQDQTRFRRFRENFCKSSELAGTSLMVWCPPSPRPYLEGFVSSGFAFWAFLWLRPFRLAPLPRTRPSGNLTFRLTRRGSL